VKFLIDDALASDFALRLLRRSMGRTSEKQATFLLSQLSMLDGPLRKGSVVVLEEDRIQIRALHISDTG
jgi:hypothetical protein